jgi:hyperosmotically inducible protein
VRLPPDDQLFAIDAAGLISVIGMLRSVMHGCLLIIHALLLTVSVFWVMPGRAAVKVVAENAEKPSLDYEERTREAAERADRAEDKAVKMLDRVVVKSRAKANASRVHDALLTAKIKLAVVSDPRVKGRDVTIETENSIVTLRGSVETEEARAATGEITASVKGVKGIKNKLKIVTLEPGTEMEIDQAVTDRVKAGLQKEAKLRNADITVHTEDGIVTLTGKVQNLLASAQAAWMAWKAKGVRAVKNELSFKSK